VCIPASEIADKLGSAKAANMVLLGALLEATECLEADSALAVVVEKVNNASLLEVNRNALGAGRQFIGKHVWVGAESQSDGFAY
jgi:Pyruvate/2-oxoacid:ferredoxin oxidoreductase gamma subunit